MRQSIVLSMILAGCGGGGGLPQNCSNGMTDVDETDVDCGGACLPCRAGMGCKGAGDCQSGFCSNNICDPPSCSDGVKNGDESDLDCGGMCLGCPKGKTCKNGLDCVSTVCTNGFCAGPACMDGKKSGSESDVDCGGGTCPKCSDGKMCLMASDCASDLCTNNVCKPAAGCVDQMKGGSETDVDCGGGVCPKCADGRACLIASDCASGNCANNLCGAGAGCNDQIKNGNETDVDCGGGCAKCANGKACLVGGDCTSGNCVNKVCQAQGGTYLPVGVVTNVPVVNLTGWSSCYTDTYASKGVLLQQVMNACSKAKLFFACRFTGQPTLLVGAWIERNKVSLLPAIAGASGSGTSWVFAQRVNDYGCWAFVPNGHSLPGGACDLDSSGPDHLSWSIYDGQFAAGYRCGSDKAINSNLYERLIYHAD